MARVLGAVTSHENHEPNGFISSSFDRFQKRVQNVSLQKKTRRSPRSWTAIVPERSASSARHLRERERERTPSNDGTVWEFRIFASCAARRGTDPAHRCDSPNDEKNEKNDDSKEHRRAFETAADRVSNRTTRTIRPSRDPAKFLAKKNTWRESRSRQYGAVERELRDEPRACFPASSVFEREDAA